jgi:3-deoxy-D-manno-octulosonate 8-phosphate phosphatase (KDO 8-P phosphatase)
MFRIRTLTGLLVGATLLLAACSSGAGGSPVSTAAPAASSAAGGATVSAATAGSLGTVLIGPDGRTLYTAGDGEILGFDIQDGLGVKLALTCGLRVAVVTGRRSEMVLRRASELGVRDVHQGVEDKLAVFHELLAATGLAPAQTAWMGDDLPDLPALRRAGLALSVPGAASVVRAAAHYVTRRPGGRGAVREAVELLLRAQDRWEAVVEAFA